MDLPTINPSCPRWPTSEPTSLSRRHQLVELIIFARKNRRALPWVCLLSSGGNPRWTSTREEKDYPQGTGIQIVLKLNLYLYGMYFGFMEFNGHFYSDYKWNVTPFAHHQTWQKIPVVWWFSNLRVECIMRGWDSLPQLWWNVKSPLFTYGFMNPLNPIYKLVRSSQNMSKPVKLKWSSLDVC